MAEILFPLNPNVGDLFPTDDPVWICYSTVPSVWNKIYSTADSTPPSITEGTEPPADPRENDQWYNTSTSKMYVWYTDADSSQWVES